MARRLFYVDEARGGRAATRGDAAQHLRRVLRVEAGQRFEISDNQTVYLAEVAGFGKGEIHWRVLETLERAPLPVRIHLYAALIKFDHFELLLEKATECGVERIVPLVAARSEKGLASAAEKRRERWLRILLESGQQARRATRPELGVCLAFGAALTEPAGLKLLLDESPGASPLLRALPEAKAAGQTVALLAGPEGGWEQGERAAAAEAGWRAVSLGPLVLRAETAALAGCAVVTAAWLAG
jgi:16S rRNA (uracil1498-N3)-methyltransferase